MFCLIDGSGCLADVDTNSFPPSKCVPAQSGVHRYQGVIVRQKSLDIKYRWCRQDFYIFDCTLHPTKLIFYDQRVKWSPNPTSRPVCQTGCQVSVCLDKGNQSVGLAVPYSLAGRDTDVLLTTLATQSSSMNDCS